MIVCDGFIGNVALKVSEGMVDMIKQMLQESLEATITRQDWLRAVAFGFQRVQEARRLFRVRRRAAAGRQRRLHHLPRPIERKRDQECYPGGDGVRGGQINRRIEEGLNGLAVGA